MRIGVHPNNLHLLLASRWPGGLGEGFAFVPYDEGRDSARLLRAGAIDVCGTGSTPPIIAQAQGLSVRMLAASAMRPANGALVVAPDSAIATVGDLAGRRVALLDGSFHTYLLARALETAGLRLPDVERVELSPAASQTALADGTVDAWVAMAPLLGPALAAGSIRMLVANTGLIPNRSLFWTLAGASADAAAGQRFTEALVRFGRTVAAEPGIAAEILAAARAGDADLAGWRQAVAARDWTVAPITADILAEQQDEANTLHRHGDLRATVAIA
jgi:ABC-type nitrate/sulfonate/bicarbonate transport system substrate-binding protein